MPAQVGCSKFIRQLTRALLAQTDSPAGTTLPEVAKFPLRNNAASAVAALNPVREDTKTKGFSP
jgi:hypothetical protein